jgi:hypothetical protein
MQFTIGTNTTGKQAQPLGLTFGMNGTGLIAISPATTPFDVTVQPFDPDRDIFYHTSESLTPEDLAEEIEIHVPRSLRDKLNTRLTSGTLGNFVMMQSISSGSPAITPLAALEKILSPIGTVNSAILQADNGGTLFIRKSGNDHSAATSTHSLKEFLNLSTDERERSLLNFQASEIIVSGSDLDHFENLDLGSLTSSRRITISDLSSFCNFTSESAAIVETNPHLYTLVIGAAAVYAEIRDSTILKQ